MKMKKPEGTPKTEKVNISGSEKIIHHATLLDSSGSMGVGGRPRSSSTTKYETAVSGINEGILALKNDNSGVTHTYTIAEFDTSIGLTGNTVIHALKHPVENVVWVPRGPGMGTPMLDAIDTIINRMLEVKQKDEPVILNIFTDGDENSSRKKTWRDIAKLIEKVEKEDFFTVTFRGTESDVENVKRKLSLKASNVISHDNTATGVANSFRTTNAQTLLYAKSYARGASVDDLTQNFYTRTEDDAKKGK